MGHAAKHLDDEEKRVQRMQKYATSEQYVHRYNPTSHVSLTYLSARAIHSAQNWCAYERHTVHTSKLKATWQHLPHGLKEQGDLPLPTNAHFFIQGIWSGDTPGGSDPLAIWDDFLPYTGSSQPLGRSNLEVLCKRLHARQYLLQKHHEMNQIPHFRGAICIDTCLGEITHDIDSLVSEWKILHAILKDFSGGTIDHTIGLLHMQWKAWRVVHLLEDWKVFKKNGMDGFLEVYCEQWWGW